MSIIQDTPPEAEQVIVESCAKHGISPNLLLGPGQTKRLVTARREVSMHLYELGYSSTKIGLILNRHHSSILHLLRRLGSQTCQP